jgi:hypothetical protein
VESLKDKYKTLIISCWVVLLCCFVVKLLGGNFFEIVCKNERFVKLCKFVDGNILKYVIDFTTYFISTFVYILAVIGKKTNKKEKIIISIALTTLWFLKLLTYNIPILAMGLEFITIIVLPILLNRKIKTFIFAIIGCALILLFQVISLMTKNIGIGFIDESTLVLLIFSIDYYIMIILFYLYRTKEAK